MNFKDNEYYKLKEICNFQEGYVNPSQKTPEYFGGDIKWLRATDLNNSYVYDTSRKLSKKGFESAGKSALLFSPNTIAISKSGTIGRLGILKDYMCGNRAVINIDIDNNNIDINYLFYWLRHQQEYIKDLAVGSVQRNLYISILEEVKIKYRPLHEQKEIAAIFKNIDKKIENNKKMNKTLEKMAQAIYKSWFVDFEPFQEEEFIYNEKLKKEIPKSFTVSSIGEKLRVELGGTPLRREDKYWNKGDINWIKSGKVNEFRITEPSEYITQEGLDNSSTTLLPKGTVVLAITGATLGQVSRLEIETCANQSVVGIVESNEIPSEYIYLWVLHRINIIIQKQTGGAQQHINKTNVKNSLLLLPPHDVMNRFIKIIKDMFSKISNNCFENQSLKELRDSLLPKLMSGEIKVPLEENAKEVN